MTNPSEIYKNRGVLSNEEIDDMITLADQLPSEYFKLRAKCLISLLKKFGKRRSEIERLTLDDITTTATDLEFTFHLSKKHKRGLSQFFRVCSKTDPAVLERPLPEIKQQWKQWQETEQGHTIKNAISIHSISLGDKYAPFILEYLDYLEKECSEAKFLFPSGTSVFGQTYVMFPETHLSGSQLLRIVKQLNGSAWLHLFRETKGAEIAKKFGRNLTSIYEVKDTLDLENEETAYRYVRRYAARKQDVET